MFQLPLLIKQYSGMVNVVQFAIQYLGVPHTRRGLNKHLKSNIGFPDIRCIQETLDKYFVSNLLTRLNLDQLSDVQPFAVILQFSRSRKPGKQVGQYGFLLEANATHVKYYSETREICEVTRAEFETRWNGIALLLRKLEGSIEPDYSNSRLANFFHLALKVLLLVVLSALVAVHAGQAQAIIWHLFIAASSLAGLYHSFLVYKLEEALEFSNEPYRKCNIYNGFDCLKVFSSKWGRVFGLLRFSYCGIIHFSTIIIFNLFSILRGEVFQNGLLYLLLLPVLFVPYSLLMQWLLIKSWCTNCLKVQGSLILNAAAAFFMFSEIGPLTLPDASTYFLIVGSTILLFESSRIVIERFYRFKTVARELQSLKADPRVFTSLHAEAHEGTPPPKGFRFIVGDDLQHEVTAVISPFCPACEDVVRELQRQLVLSQVHFEVNLLISASGGKEKSMVAQTLISLLYTKTGPHQILQTLLEWYRHQDVDRLKRQHGPEDDGHKEKAKRTAETTKQYLHSIGANYTPLLLFQQKLVSPWYSFTELTKLLK